MNMLRYYVLCGFETNPRGDENSVECVTDPLPASPGVPSLQIHYRDLAGQWHLENGPQIGVTGEDWNTGLCTHHPCC